MARPGVALQMYTVREQAQADFAGTVRAVAQMGYPAIQFAGYGGLSADQMKRLLDELGLKVAGSHVGLSQLEGDLNREIDYNLAVGNRDLIVPALPREMQQDESGFKRAVQIFNQLGARCKEQGARLSYHNHAFEFVQFDGRTAMELLLDETDPSVVVWEPDVYWIAYANEDPTAWIRRYAGRCPYIHLKDMTKDESRTFAEVGEGRFDFQPIFEASEAGGAEWYVVEQDRCARPALESAALSLRHLQEWGKV